MFNALNESSRISIIFSLCCQSSDQLCIFLFSTENFIILGFSGHFLGGAKRWPVIIRPDITLLLSLIEVSPLLVHDLIVAIRGQLRYNADGYGGNDHPSDADPHIDLGGLHSLDSIEACLESLRLIRVIETGCVDENDEDLLNFSVPLVDVEFTITMNVFCATVLRLRAIFAKQLILLVNSQIC